MALCHFPILSVNKIYVKHVEPLCSYNIMKHLLGKFAYLPNGIIREIVAYTGATYKKRNGKYMGQIPKTDPRFALLLKIPKKKIIVNDHLVSNLNCKYFNSWVNLTRIHERCFTIRLAVFGITYINDPIFGNRETIKYECRICDWRGDVRFETYTPLNIFLACNCAI